MSAENQEVVLQDGKIECKLCGSRVHAIVTHLAAKHPEVTIDEYKALYPNEPLLSPLAEQKLKEESEKRNMKEQKNAGRKFSVNLLYQVFNLDKETPGITNARKEYIKCQVLDRVENSDDVSLIPDIDNDYIYDVPTLRDVLLAIGLNKPLMVWGHTGTGKTTLLEQVFARTNRPCLRVQHTANTEERDIVGQFLVKEGETKFNLGPLAMAMKYGWVYLADEYDFAMPQVTSVYQPILEGKPLVIKEADLENRIIRPHPDFRFVATGNTNGTGDETLLYSGTTLQNSANYDRFNVVIEKDYMPTDLEIAMVINKTTVKPEIARKIVDFGKRVRDSYKDGKLSSPISPRTLVSIGQIGLAKDDYKAAIKLTFSNKLNRIDKEVADSLAQRIFG